MTCYLPVSYYASWINVNQAMTKSISLKKYPILDLLKLIISNQKYLIAVIDTKQVRKAGVFKRCTIPSIIILFCVLDLRKLSHLKLNMKAHTLQFKCLRGGDKIITVSVRLAWAIW